MLDLESIRSFLEGTNRFFSHFQRRDLKERVVWQDGSTSVLNYTQNDNSSLPILFFIPSLINKSYILDLTEETSMVKYFASLGYPVCLVNFSEVLEDETDMGFAEYLARVEKSLEYICKNQAVVTIGYCLGGVFSCALHAGLKKNLLGQVLIATPWDLSHLKEAFGLNNPLILHNLKMMFNNCNKLSPAIIQWCFSSLNPGRIWTSFCQFASMQEQEDIDKFLMIQQWVNDGVSLTKKFALQALSMIENNDLQNSKFFALNTKTPSLIINGLEDKIVPPSSCEQLYKNILNHQAIIEPTGHIGLIISKLSREKIWPEITNWLKNF